jgi:hypothetical protein
MFIWPNSRVILACGAMLISLAMTPTTYAADSASLSTHASFDLATYREMKRSVQGALGLILTAMRETVFCAQNSVGTSVICASPRPIAVPELVAIVDKEIRARSTASMLIMYRWLLYSTAR